MSSLLYHSSFGHYLKFGYFTLLHFLYFETECRLQTFSRAVFLNTWVKINATQVMYILFQRKVGIRAGNGGTGAVQLPKEEFNLPADTKTKMK